MSETKSFQALEWVSEEIEETLKQAVDALDAFVEHPEDVTKLRFCMTYLYQISGSLKMIELNGPALLAKEVEELLNKALEETNSALQVSFAKTIKKALEDLIEYLAQILATRKDRPTDLLPVLNNLREVAQQEKLSASDVFDPDVSKVEPLAKPAAPKIAVNEFNELIRKLRIAFQKSVIGIVRNEDLEKNYQLARKVCETLFKVSRNTASEPLWNIAFAITDCLQQQGMAADLEFKKALRLIDGEIRQLAEKGKDVLSHDADSAQLKSLLYCVATAETPTEAILKLREQYQLESALPEDEEVPESAESVLYKVCVAQLMADLDTIKKRVSEKLTFTAVANRIQNTLPLLALESQLGAMDSLIADAESGGEVSDVELEQFKEACLSKLEDESNIVAAVKQYSAYIDNAREGFESIKGSVVEFVATQWDKETLAELPATMVSQLALINLSTLPGLAAIFTACRNYVEERLINSSEQPEMAEIEALADVISSVEYYLESCLSQNQDNLAAIVEVARQSLAELSMVPVEEAIEPVQVSLIPTEVADSKEGELIEPIEPVAASSDQALEQVAIEEESEATQAVVTVEEEFFSLAPEDVDEEILEIFIEEGAEVLENMDEYLPALQADYDNEEALLEVRRGWHTLKGSGRMVGATHMGDFAWAIEQMLNRVRDGGGKITDNCIAVINEAKAKVPDVLKSLEDGQPFGLNTLKVTIAKADAEREGKILSDAELAEIIGETAPAEALKGEAATEETVSQSQDLVAEVEEPVAVAEDDEDESLEAIFVQEALSHIKVLTDFLDGIDPAFEDVEVSQDLQRAFHTLKGSAYMAEIASVAVIADPLEHFAKDLSNFQIKADADVLAIFMRAHELLNKEIQAIQTGESIDGAEGEALAAEILLLQKEKIGNLSQAEEQGGIVDKYASLLSSALECMDEATELLAQWKSQEGLDATGQDKLVEVTQRLATTADEANYKEVAALSEALVVFYNKPAVNDNQAMANDAFFELSDQAQDELDDMMDIIAAHQIVDSPDALIKQLVDFTADAIDAEVAHDASDEAVDDKPKIDEPSELAQDSAAETGIVVSMAEFKRQLQSVDEEMLEIFIEEAQELVDELDEEAQRWHDDKSNSEPAAGLKRILHTLKGGARMAELSVLGDLTHDFETMIEHAEARSQFDDEFFSKLDAYHVACEKMVAVLLSGNYEVTEDDLATQPVSEQIVEASETLEVEPVAEEENVDAGLAEDVSQEIEEIVEVAEAVVVDEPGDEAITEPEPEPEPDLEPEISQAPAVAMDDSFKLLSEQFANADEDTIEIFMEEAGELVEALDASASEWLSNHEDVAQAAELKRVLHTLKGGARLAELSALGDLTHDYETMIEQAEARSEFNGLFFERVQSYQDKVQVMVDFLLTGAVYQEPVEAGPAEANAEQTESVASAGSAGGVADYSDLDPELLALFIEEASELNDGIEAAVAKHMSDRSSKVGLDELKRVLHTLKGGARMAGVGKIGDMSHDFETYIIDAERAGKHETDEFIDIIQLFQDRLVKLFNTMNASLSQADAAEPVEESSLTASVVPIRPDVDPDAPPVQVSQAAIDATRNFIETLNKEKQRSNKEPIKLSQDQLQTMINLAGESSISRSRIEEYMNEMGFSLDEMDSTVDRLHVQLRRLEIETEAQIVFRQEQVGVEGIENFDPLEMDRYSAMQQLSKSLIEATSDLDDISATINGKMRDMETILLQQSRINTELQEGLMRAQMVPFSRMVPRLRRIVRQVAGELGKKIDFKVENAEGELDRTILERMIAPLEHMLRNAVDHGVEMPADRKASGKKETGTINLSLSREGGEVILTLQDDGAGVNLDAVKKKAIERGLMTADQKLSDNEVAQFILHAGFSTAEKVTQISGRGVGMDVVHSEIKQLGGAVDINSKAGEGTTFHVHLPFTVSVNRALMVSVGNDIYAIPLNTIEGIVRVSPYELEAYYQPDAPLFEYAGQGYELKYMGSLLQHGHQARLEGLSMPLPVILIRSSDYTVAVQVDKLFGSREVVVKSLGPQFSMVEGVSGATVLGNGNVVIILDMLALIRADAARSATEGYMSTSQADAAVEQRVTTVMVTDDSVTVRKVTSRLLERYGFKVILAKDGQDAVTQLQDMVEAPDIMLLDIEMPRMDGFEVLSRVRHNNMTQDMPVVMITSRTGEKHRERAMSLGASRYLGKPFQERELLQTIGELTGNHVLEA